VEEAYDLAVLMAKACPKPEKRLMGLTELMVNAVEHGNLGMSYLDKSQLNREREWPREVARRLSLAEYADKSATIQFERDREKISFTIRDQGEGFNWPLYMQLDPERAFDSHGRIAMANMISFDHMEYRGSGNEVVAMFYLE
jgi:anti-sigma regulatory factor (Ser/Thr protein kinase)